MYTPNTALTTASKKSDSSPRSSLPAMKYRANFTRKDNTSTINAAFNSRMKVWLPAPNTPLARSSGSS